MVPCEIVFQMCIDAVVIIKRMDSFKSIKNLWEFLA